MLYIFCPISDGIKFSEQFNWSIMYSYQVNQIFTSWYSGLYCPTLQSPMVKEHKRQTRALTVADSKPALSDCFETSKYLLKTFTWRRLGTDDLQLTSASDWPIDQPEPVAFKARLKSVYVSQKVKHIFLSCPAEALAVSCSALFV